MLDIVQMERLELSRNRIAEIAHCAFCPCLRLAKLDLSHNLLTNIAHAFGDSRHESLNILDLSHNMIQVEVKMIFPSALL